jgi:hypothetical protein
MRLSVAAHKTWKGLERSIAGDPDERVEPARRHHHRSRSRAIDAQQTWSTLGGIDDA